MDFQYYETLLDKSDKNLVYYAEKISPFFTNGEIQMLLDDLAGKNLRKGKQSRLIAGFIEIGDDYDKIADLSKLDSKKLKQLYQIFISEEINDKKAVKWRFYQYLKFARGLTFKAIYINQANNQDNVIDLILEMDNGEIIFVVCVGILELENYMDIINSVIEFGNTQDKYSPDKVIIAANKSYRNIPIKETIKIQDKSVIPELWIEWLELNKPFNGDDLIIVYTNNEENLKLSGFNFKSMQDLLDYIYEYTDGGQISIFKQLGFLSEITQQEPRIELIWKGIMMKRNIS
ncbi:MAG: hypothetical protein ACFFAN_05810 [Promethearchaeota archaeon]